MLRLYLIRHGETDWSISGQHTGHTDIPLTTHGENQARLLETSFRHINFAHVFTSPWQRARQTCELAGLGSAAQIEPDLKEWDYGDYEGLDTMGIRKLEPEWNVFRDGCPGGETPAQVSKRVDRLIGHLRTLKGNIALFSHGQLGGVLGARWIGLALAQGQHFALGTASISILGYEHDHSEIPVISLWNATAQKRTIWRVNK